jgi:hypothetical protein
MKTATAILLAFGMIAVVPGCGSKKAEDTKAEKQKPGFDLKSRTEKASKNMTKAEKEALKKAQKDALGE